MIDRHELVEYAEYIAELYRLADEGLVIAEHGQREGFQFPQPDHPRVVAWRSHRIPDPDMRDRAWLLYEAGQMLARAKASQQPPGVIESARRFAMSIPDMTMADVHRHLGHFLHGETAGQA